MFHQNPDTQIITTEQISSVPKNDDSDEEILRQKIHKWRAHPFEETDLMELVHSIYSNNEHLQIYGAIGIRKLLSNQFTIGPVQAVIDANAVPKLLQFTQDGNNVDLQLEAIWTLTNIASGTEQQTQYIVDQGAIPSFVRLLSSPLPEIAEHAVWGIANIAADSTTFRDMVINNGALAPLIYLVDHFANQETIKSATWAISNLCRGNPKPKFELVKSAIPPLCKIIITQTNEELLAEAAYGLSFLTQMNHDIDADLAKQLIPCLLKYINSPNGRLSVQCLRTLGELTLNDTNQRMALADPNYLPSLFRYLYDHNRVVSRTACWIISNITAGDATQVQAVMGNPYYVDIVIKVARNYRDTQGDVAYVLSNSIELSTYEQLSEMIDLGVLDCLLYLLDSENTKSVIIAAQGILHILDKGIQVDNVGRKKNGFLDILIDRGGIEKIERLQIHTNEHVYLIANKILKTHFFLECN